MILSVTGLQAAPVWNVSLVDLVFRDAAPTFLDRHDVPSQGDWALVHTATVVAKGTEGFLMKGCLVTRADGQGVLLEGCHRDAVLLQNEFELIGSHAMVSWGKTSDCLDANCSRKVPGGGDGPDGRNDDQPIGTLVEANVVHETGIYETGIYERQGTMWNRALTAKTTLKNNIFFNCDRASLNINDGCKLSCLAAASRSQTPAAFGFFRQLPPPSCMAPELARLLLSLLLSLMASFAARPQCSWLGQHDHGKPAIQHGPCGEQGRGVNQHLGPRAIHHDAAQRHGIDHPGLELHQQQIL